MATYKGVIRLKCVDLANWAANQGLFNDVSASDTIRFGTEGMETVMVYVQKATSIEDLQQELCDAMDASIAKFSGMNADFDDNGAYWTFEDGAAHAKDGKALATVSYADSQATIKARYTEKTNTSDWTVQLYQNVEGQVLREGHSYKLVMNAKIDKLNVTNLRMEFLAADRAAINNAEPKTDIIFTEANKFETIESPVYTMTKDVTVNRDRRITLLLGEYSDDYTLTIDSLHIVEVTE